MNRHRDLFWVVRQGSKSSPTRWIYIHLFCIVFFGSGLAQAAVYRVGEDAACTHATLQAALNAAATNPAGPHTVRVVAGPRNTPNLEIVDPAADIRIIGGHLNCSALAPGDDSVTVLRNDPDNPVGKRVLRVINGNALPRRTINLEHLEIEGGRSPSSDFGWGGGILALGKTTVVLERLTQVRDNHAANGGGIALFNFTGNPDQFTRLVITQNSGVENNRALGTGEDGNGGGIFAIGGTVVEMRFGGVRNNLARRHGGGLYLGGNTDALEFTPPGLGLVQITGNQAGESFADQSLGFGGGIYANRATIRYTNGDTPGGRSSLIIRNNVANFGGGLYLEGSAQADGEYNLAELRNVELIANEARGSGGAILLRNAVALQVRRWGAGSCAIAGRQRPCTKIQSNRSRNGEFLTGFGAGPVARMVHAPDARPPVLQISGALVAANEDVFGTTATIDARGDSIVEVTRSIFVNNSAFGTLMFRSLIEIGGNFLDFGHNTVLGQDSQLASLFYTPPNESLISAYGSILYVPGVPLINEAEDARITHDGCLHSHTLTGLMPNAQVFVSLGPPNLDADFIPRGGSPLLDRCDLFSSLPLISPALDAFGNATVDNASIPNAPSGPIDLGALERVDLLFYGGFGVRPNN